MAETARGETTKEAERFRQFSTREHRGPLACVVLLGLETFAAQDLLKTVGKGLAYRTCERRQRNNLPVEALLELVDIRRRSLTRRKREGRFLSRESDRLPAASQPAITLVRRSVRSAARADGRSCRFTRATRCL